MIMSVAKNSLVAWSLYGLYLTSVEACVYFSEQVPSTDLASERREIRLRTYLSFKLFDEVDKFIYTRFIS